MAMIQIEIDSSGNNCGECQGLDEARDHCDIFSIFLDTEDGEEATRCGECLGAEV